MSTKQQAYDHAAYLVADTFNFAVGTAPSGQATPRQVVFTNMIAKSATLSISIVGTNTSTVALLRLVNTNTTTTTLASFIIGTGVVAGTSCGTSVGQNINLLCGTTTMNQGDQVWLVNGIDLSVGYGITMEAYLVPGANLTV